MKDLFHLGHGDPENISLARRSYLRRFQTLQRFRTAMKQQENIYWLAKLAIYDLMKARLGGVPKCFDDLMCRMEQQIVDCLEADVVFSTVHQAKGLGFENVVTLDDFLDARTEEEYNIFYVACSRVSTGTLIVAESTVEKLGSRKRVRDYEEDSWEDSWEEDSWDEEPEEEEHEEEPSF